MFQKRVIKRLEAEVDKVFSAREPSQMIYKFKLFGYQLHLHHQGNEIAIISEDENVVYRGI
jgi:hypothetical protein